MAQVESSLDPRRGVDSKEVITASAFRVSPELLGIPLASHWKRMGAILVDLLLVALIANQLGGFVLGVLAAVFFFRMAMRPRKAAAPDRPVSATSAAIATTLRGTAGCMGGLIAFVLVLVVVSSGPWSSWGGSPSPPSGPRADVAALGNVSNLEREILEDLGEDPTREEIEAYVTARLGGFLARGLGSGSLGELPPEASEALRQAEEAGVDLSALDTALLAAPADPDPAGADEAESAEPVSPEVAALQDSLRAVTAAYQRELQLRRQARAEVAELRAQPEPSPSIRAMLRSLAEDLGLGIGWSALYFSVFMTWWQGRTPGKRLFRLRVVRLDRGRITWWTALERYGGYAAGFATGLLGFLQVFWDPNRQATHDKIAGTVVVQGGKAPLPGFGNPGNP